MYEVNSKKTKIVLFAAFACRGIALSVFWRLWPTSRSNLSSNIFLLPQSVSCTKKSSVGGSIREIAAGAQNKDSTRLHGSQRERTHESMIKDFSEKVVCKTRQHPPPWLFTESELGSAYMIKDC